MQEVNIPRHVALYREICRAPEDDTLRLAYADCLDEIGDERVECPNPNCGNPVVGWDGFYQCSRCKGAGTVLSTANRDRAEFIRVQVEIERLHTLHQGTGQTIERLATVHGPIWDCRQREKELLRLHPEWRECPCPKCDGTNRMFDGCPCGGSGDLFHPFGDGAKPRLVHFRRGFPDSVECVAADVWREGLGYRVDFENWRPEDGSRTVTVPTEWAKAVVRCTPVSKFKVELEPTREEGGWEWYGHPDVFNTSRTKQTFKTVDEAKEALAAELGEWVRREPHDKEKR
jgi:uncharacterized protein (TIGR02996 family)